MPQYQIPLGESGARWRQSPALMGAYLEAMFWTECNPDNDELEHATLDELSDEAWDQVLNDCSRFQALRVKLGDDAACLDDAQCGHDFWLTRNHHGVGFWDRGLGALGDELTTLAHSFGETSLYRGDDGKLYLD